MGIFSRRKKVNNGKRYTQSSKYRFLVYEGKVDSKKQDSLFDSDRRKLKRQFTGRSPNRKVWGKRY